MKTLKSAFGIVKEKEMGSAFDQELQERKRLDRMADKERIKKEEKRQKKEKKRKIEKEEILK